MKITEEILKALNAKEIDKEKRIWQIGGFELKWVRHAETFYGVTVIDEYEVWQFGPNPLFHIVTDVEELIRLAFEDGFIAGRNSLRDDFRTLLREE